jgi:hypothetical protein
MMNAATDTLDLVVSDVTGTRRVKAAGVARGATIAEAIRDLLVRMGLRREDGDGVPMHYRLRLDREARHLGSDELVGEALEPDDRVTLHPSADAGATR